MSLADEPLRVVIVGGGFGGLETARRLRGAPVRITLIDRRNFHLFQPLLYQVATGGLSPANIAAPLRRLLRRQRNTRVLLAEATGIDAERREVLLSDGQRVPYDELVVATGARHDYFGNDAWEPLAPGLKTVEDATEIRGRVLVAFERAERETDAAAVEALLTFVVVGGGPTGVELAGALAEVARDTLVRDFRRIDPAAARIVLVEAGERILSTYPPELSAKAAAALARLGVTVRTGASVVAVDDASVTVRPAGSDRTEHIAARTVLWAAGVRASALGALLAEATGATTDRVGRVRVGADLAVPRRPEIHVIGDLAHVPWGDGRELPGIAPVAIQQGRYVARCIANRARGRAAPPAFTYRHRGDMATIGRTKAVAVIGRLRLSGWPAWLAWIAVHLVWLMEFENRVLVLVQWAWNWATRNRSARLITDVPACESDAPERRGAGSPGA